MGHAKEEGEAVIEESQEGSEEEGREKEGQVAQVSTNSDRST